MEEKSGPIAVAAVPDDILVLHVGEGDRQAFADLLDRHRDAIRRSIARNVDDAHAAEDLFQETCLRAFKSLRERIRPDNVEAWLRGIAKNCVREWYRKKGTGAAAKVEPTAAVPLDALQETERREVVKRSLLELSEDARNVLLMRHHREMTFDEIARAMDKPIGTVMSLACRAYKQMRGPLSIYEGME